MTKNFNHLPVHHWCREMIHDDVIKLKHFPRYWSFKRGIHQSKFKSDRNILTSDLVTVPSRLRDLTIRRLIGYWNGALVPCVAGWPVTSWPSWYSLCRIHNNPLYVFLPWKRISTTYRYIIGVEKCRMMTSSNGNIFRVTGPLCGEFTGHRWIPRIKASDVELWCFLWFAPE